MAFSLPDLETAGSVSQVPKAYPWICGLWFIPVAYLKPSSVRTCLKVTRPTESELR